MELAHLSLLFLSPHRTSSSDTWELYSDSLYVQDMIGTQRLDFVKLLHKCLDYDPGQHIHQLQKGLIIFYAFRNTFTSQGLYLYCKTHPEVTQTSQRSCCSRILIKMIRSLELFLAYCFKDCEVTLGFKQWCTCRERECVYHSVAGSAVLPFTSFVSH